MVLGINLFVIAWGAYVRASGAGAGCGAHWPLCNGEVVPHRPAVATLIELTHRVTSGMALLLVVGLVVGARRAFPRGHQVRAAAYAAGALIVSEALIGAGLVLFKMVAHNESVARGWWISAHLTNTFLLVASLTLTAWFAGGAEAPRVRGSGAVGLTAAVLLALALFLGVSGAITALGDTLFPVDSLRAGFRQDLDESAHLFLRLRRWHPLIAVTFAAVGIGGTRWMVARVTAMRAGHPQTALFALLFALLVAVQLCLGVLNIALLAPIWLQLVHLLLADAVWILLVLFVAAALERPRPAAFPR